MKNSIPEGYSTLTPMFIFKDVRKAIEFYKKAFRAEERYAVPGPDGEGIMHAELRIGSSVIMLSEESTHCPGKSAETIGSSPISFYVYVGNVDEAFRVAVEAGARISMQVEEMFWGDRVGMVQDPFGYSWSLATHTRDLTPQQIMEGAKEACAKMSEK